MITCNLSLAFFFHSSKVNQLPLFETTEVFMKYQQLTLYSLTVEVPILKQVGLLKELGPQD